MKIIITREICKKFQFCVFYENLVFETFYDRGTVSFKTLKYQELLAMRVYLKLLLNIITAFTIEYMTRESSAEDSSASCQP